MPWQLVSCTLCCAVLVLGYPAMGAEGDARQTFTDPAEAGEDYQVQGEYQGSIDLGEGEEQKFGLQVIALGSGTFGGVAYFGGLPGDGWDGVTKIQAEGALKDGVLILEAGEGSAEITDGKGTIRDSSGQELGTIEKVERVSPTLGAEPPEGAIVLFDGTSADAFDGGRMTDEGYLKVPATSKRKFQDHVMHLEFRTPFMPHARGQARGNSGVYIQDRYELQILDSFGLEGLDNECGGFYSLRAPRENMCFPPLVWQTYDIDFAAARYDDDGNKVAPAKVTVKHNGVVIHNDLELTAGTPGRADEGPEPLGVHLQFHGNPVVFRNIWVVERQAE